MSWRAFVHFPKTCIKRVIFVLSWFCWLVGIGLLIYQLHELIVWSFNFPPQSGIRTSSFCLLFSIQIFSMWMPFSILLTFWNKRKKWAHILYICGCLLTLILAITSTIVLDPYKNDGEVRKEYILATQTYIDERQSLPRWIKSIDADGHKCCGWFSPLDLGTIFPLTGKLKRNKQYLDEVASCFGDIFKVIPNKENSQDFEFTIDVTGVKPDYAHGCGNLFKLKAREMCYFTVYCGFIISIFALIFIGTYTIFLIQGNPLKRKRRKDKVDVEKGKKPALSDMSMDPNVNRNEEFPMQLQESITTTNQRSETSELTLSELQIASQVPYSSYSESEDFNYDVLPMESEPEPMKEKKARKPKRKKGNQT